MRGRLVVVGDLLLDVDVAGSVARLAPDAPVPVVDDPVERARPGGAGLAALLAAADGREVVLVAPGADDDAGARACRLLDGVLEVIPVPATGSTPEKRRIRAGGQTLLRVDRGRGAVPYGELPVSATRALAGADAVLVADYGRGMAAWPTLRAALTEVRRPVVWDPHPCGPVPVAGARLVTPNAAEAGVAGRPLAEVAARAAELARQWRAAGVAVTLGARGALLSAGSDAPLAVPAPPVDPYGAGDPCGAGDCFAGTVAGALADGALPSEAVVAAVRAASAFVAAGGAGSVCLDGPDGAARPADAGAPADPYSLVARIRAAGGTVVATGGCFDLLHAGHIALLRAARQLGDCLVVCLNSDDSVRRLKGPGRPVVGQRDRAQVLAAIGDVDAVVVFDEDTPERVIATLRPDVWAKGGDYEEEQLPEAAVLHEWGGQIVLLPYLEGRSTSSLLDRTHSRSDR